MDPTAVTIAAIAGIVISLLFSYTPGLKDWFDALAPTPKRLLMLGVLLLTTIGLLVYRCRADGACYSANVETYLAAFIAALAANQSAASITPLPPRRRLIRKQIDDQHMAAASVALPTSPKP